MGGKGTIILYLNKLPWVGVIFKNWPSFKGKSLVVDESYTYMSGGV